jgi:hypothetical protein
MKTQNEDFPTFRLQVCILISREFELQDITHIFNFTGMRAKVITLEISVLQTNFKVFAIRSNMKVREHQITPLQKKSLSVLSRRQVELIYC